MTENFVFRLYIAGRAPNSNRAVSNLQSLCRELLQGRHEIEIIDVARQPRRALSDGVMLTPLVIRVSPGPEVRVLGNLSERRAAGQLLGLPAPGDE